MARSDEALTPKREEQPSDVARGVTPRINDQVYRTDTTMASRYDNANHSPLRSQSVDDLEDSDIDENSPLSQRKSTERLITATEQGQDWQRLDDLDASDLSENEDADEMTAALKNWKRDGSITRVKDCGTVFRVLCRRNRLCMAISGVLLLIFLPWMVYGSRFRSWMFMGNREWRSPPWYPSPRGGTLDSWTASYQKAKVLVERMSLPEKVNITTGTGWSMGMCVGNTGPALEAGFPSLCLQDGPLGIRFADNITAFPAGLTAAATWNRRLIEERGFALGTEARGKGINVMLGPSMGPLGIMPAGGRNWEGFSPDPVLSGIAAAATIRGIQSTGVMATAKHFVLNEQEHFRQAWEWLLPYAMSSNIGDRALHEVFVWPFADSVRANVASVMCSYQMANNSYACENSKLINGILKDELGFQGFVQSDWGAQRSGVISGLAGLDMSMPGDGLGWADGKSLWGKQLTIAVLNGTFAMERLNDMVTRIVASWYQLKQDGDEGGPRVPNFSSFTDEEYGPLYPGSGDSATGRVNQFIDVQGSGKDAHSITARSVAAEGTVLVKNVDHILPLNADGPQLSGKYRVAIIGEDAGPGDGPNACPDRNCNQGTLGSGWGSGAVEFPYLITPLEALQRIFNSSTVDVTDILTNKTEGQNLGDQDLCMVFVNADAGEGFASWEDVKGDRNDLFLQKGGDALIQKVANGCGGDTIVVVHAVGPVVLESWIDHPQVKAVVLAHLPGEESGNALVDVLFGTVDASGRLPYTIGKSLADYGPNAQVLYWPNAMIPQVNFTDGLYIDYRYFDKHEIAPRYEFGYGLSYTTFTLSKLNITAVQEKSPLPSPRPTSSVVPPSYSTKVPDAQSALFPAGIRQLYKYIYPYISDLSEITKGRFDYPDGYDTAQEPSPAGGGEGGNPSLYETFVTVTVDAQNTGNRTGQAVVQLYVSFPDGVVDHDEDAGYHDPIDFPVRVLRAFDKVAIQPGQTARVQLSLTRRDLSFWSVRRQNWVMPNDGRFKIWVGQSSRDLPLVGEY